MRKFKLVKLYPGSLPLGTEVNYSETHQVYNYNGGTYYTELPKHAVENLPEYWQEVKEVKLDVPIGTKFKTELKSTLYTIECIEGNRVQISWDTGSITHGYRIEDVNEYFKKGSWTIYKEKEYEILEQQIEIIESNNWFEGRLYNTSIETKKIISVKRLSDNVIFQLNDKVVVDEFNTSPLYNKGEIKYFNIAQDGHMRVEISNGCNISISKIEHSKHLFLDELGNEVFEGDSYYFIFNLGGELYLRKIDSATITSGKTSTDKYFKYEKDAQRYFDNNKPIYSKKQIRDAMEKTGVTWFNYDPTCSVAYLNLRFFQEKLGL